MLEISVHLYVNSLLLNTLKQKLETPLQSSTVQQWF